ncbi:ABC transporter ATP-binding protein [Paraburkholderia sp. JPY419]|uniref:ABC transporter ATP-binding protein n=1 Tax=Paraburkholderia sp. JPY419 TaxID=667660 RepID=UPI003D1D0319
MSALLEMSGVSRDFTMHRSLLDKFAGRPAERVRAVTDVDLAIAPGECLGLIGESGCGKSTLGRLALRLREPTAGAVRFAGTDLGALDAPALAALRPRMQIIFQDPYASLNPRRNVEEIVGLPLRLHERLTRTQRRERVMEAIEWVGLGAQHLQRYPHQFSGGQRQRVGIARALVLRPEFVVCDEPVSALDVSVQAQIVALLARLRKELGLAYLFISHDIAVVAHLSDRIAVMYLGRIVESGPARAIVDAPRHPYTQALLSAVPRAHGPRLERIRLAGDPPSALHPPTGCAFHTRCPHAMPICSSVTPPLIETERSRFVACHLYPASAPGGLAPHPQKEITTCNP